MKTNKPVMGRPVTLDPAQRRKARSVSMSDIEFEKFKALGGVEWLRNMMSQFPYRPESDFQVLTRIATGARLPGRATARAALTSTKHHPFGMSSMSQSGHVQAQRDLNQRMHEVVASLPTIAQGRNRTLQPKEVAWKMCPTAKLSGYAGHWTVMDGKQYLGRGRTQREAWKQAVTSLKLAEEK